MVLPASIDEIKRLKLKTEGEKQSGFLIGSRFILQWMDELSLRPFERKSNKVYQAHLKDSMGEPF